jgi:6,7-dimethyl-8-ribityllumazine synthase
MSTVIEGLLQAGGKRFGIVAGRFNELITRKLLEGAMDCLMRHNAQSDDITIVWVPGAFELPLAARKLAESGKYDAVICLGAVIRGSTPHFDYVASQAAKGIAAVALETGKPVVFGVLTTDTIEQAIERAGTKAGNKGFAAAMNAIEMADVLAKL